MIWGLIRSSSKHGMTIGGKTTPFQLGKVLKVGSPKRRSGFPLGSPKKGQPHKNTHPIGEFPHMFSGDPARLTNKPQQALPFFFGAAVFMGRGVDERRGPFRPGLRVVADPHFLVVVPGHQETAGRRQHQGGDLASNEHRGIWWTHLA